jgi:short-subunit dehydrogenase
MSELTNKTILITGTNRGIGKALLAEILSHNPAKVYATARNSSLIATNDERVVKVELELTDPESILSLKELGNIDILINNAGVLDYGEPTLQGDTNMQINYLGTVSITNTLLPQLNQQGSILFLSSIIGLAPMKGAYGYSASKAAIHSYTQAMRMKLDGTISVHGVYPGAIETDMTKGMEMAKADVNETAKQILAQFEEGKTYIFPDSMSAPLGAAYLENPVSLEESLKGF